MPKFAANLTMMYGEHAFLDRFAAAATDGFKGVEFLFPYAFPASEIAARLKDHGLTQALHNLPAGDWDAGERGVAILTGRQQEFRDGVTRAIDYAGALGCGTLNCLAGKTPAGEDPTRLRATLIDNLAYAAATLKAAGIKLVIEPINTFDIPGFYLNHTAQAAGIVAEVGSDNLFIQHDLYHMQRMEGELARTVEANLPLIGHIQIADNPGRNEPGTGEIAWPFLFALLDRVGYAGWVGCEYKPAGGTSAGLGWFAPYRA